MNLPSLEELKALRKEKKQSYKDIQYFGEIYLHNLKKAEEEMVQFIYEHPHMLEKSDQELSGQVHMKIKRALALGVSPICIFSLYLYKYSTALRWYFKAPLFGFFLVVPPLSASSYTSDLYTRLDYYLIDKYTPRYQEYLLNPDPRVMNKVD